MSGFMKEFKEFAMKGNIVDLAVAVVIGGAFGKIVTSLVNDIVMPLIGLIMGKISFADLKIVLVQKTAESPEVAILIGSFIQSLIDFLIIAFSIFLVIKALNSFKKKEEQIDVPATPPKQELLLEEIRDLLKKQ